MLEPGSDKLGNVEELKKHEHLVPEVEVGRHVVLLAQTIRLDGVFVNMW